MVSLLGISGSRGTKREAMRAVTLAYRIEVQARPTVYLRLRQPFDERGGK